MSIKPFHSLFLEGDASRQHKSKTPNHDERVDDYLSRRSEFREKISSQRRAEYVEGGSTADRGDAKDMITNLRKAASKLEIAMTVCCERVAYRADDSGLIHRSRIIPVFPANYVVPEKSNSSKDPPNENSKPTATNLGILRSGKSMHFLKLLVMNCPRHEVAHRALAVAILQRTVEWEISSIGHPQLKTSSFDLFNFTGDEQLIKNTIGLLNTDLKESFTMHAKRTKSFLAAGGMKLLARWLVDSFTVVSAPSSNHKNPPAQHIASPTGCLLLPILHLLKFIPFEKSLVVESQIHKSIKRLKKLLTVLVEGLDPNSLEEVVHPIAGGLSVGKVIASIDTVMSLWKKAAAVESIADSSLKFDSFDQLQKRVQRRFDYLEKMQNEVGNPPMWLPKSMLGAWRATPSNMEKLIDASHPLRPSSQMISHAGGHSFERQGSFLDLKSKTEHEKRTDQGVSVKKRAGSPTLLEVSKQFKKQVSWAD